jgi:acetyl-CoA C-acetyltransferase
LTSFSATELGGFTIRSALERAGLSGEQVDYVLMGHVLQAGAGQITARQAAVNKVCLSGMDAVYLWVPEIRSRR